ncbi:hypothetical protein PISMIDRAFT_672391 [Pisolithus microcarpus 441]|uniref:Uncharacterized protein n=1 Tax=Pisolithus microcarpus 441 TaxID=765257 RepID=A0A0C9YVH8_9AGAM|nr:hypothetical protein PISMIDRAFT_672391 [Pisolithus microcarpus 441]
MVEMWGSTGLFFSTKEDVMDSEVVYHLGEFSSVEQVGRRPAGHQGNDQWYQVVTDGTRAVLTGPDDSPSL